MSRLPHWQLMGASMHKHAGFAEQALLAMLLAEPESLTGAIECIEAGDFLVHQHRWLYRGLCELAGVGLLPTAPLLRDWLIGQGGAGAQGLDARLALLGKLEAGSDRIRGLFSHVRTRSAPMAEGANGEPATRSDFPDAGPAGESCRSVAAEPAGPETSIGIGEALSGALAVLRRRFDGADSAGLRTGFDELDRITGGLQSGEFIVLGGRPAMGKTTFALNVAAHAATRSKKTVAVFSIDTPVPEVARRLISSHGHVDLQRLRTGQLDDEHWGRVTNAIRALKETRIFIDDTPSLSTSALRCRCRRLKREHGLDLVVVDYLQLMQVPGHDGSRSAEVAEISRCLKALARELNVPVLALSQLNRSLETRANKRPVMADLRESGSIEQDADLILLIYREEYYNKETAEKGMAEIIVGKHRGGPTGSVRLRFLGEYASFDNLGDGLAAFE